MNKAILHTCIFFILLASGNLYAQEKIAFPGAEGFGKFATGGRGGKVIVVSNLNDNGPGSLREAIKMSGPRIIMFSVSGTITLESDLPIDNDDVTIAGQSAPGDGICIRNYPVRVSADNVIIRYMRFRLGDESGVQDDAFKGRGNTNVIIDHCSMSWSVDECASFYRNSKFTMQWCIISESLNKSVHEKGSHGYGGIWGGESVSFHHNLIANHNSRNPRFSGSSSTTNSENELVDFRNNVIYNWGSNSIYGGESGNYNMVNNYFKAGPATPESKQFRIVNPSEPYGKFYVSGNFIVGSDVISSDNWEGGVQCDEPASARVNNPFDVIQIPDEAPEEAYSLVLESAGASFCRDDVDKRIVKDVRNGTAGFGNGIIDSQKQVGGWPELKSAKALKDIDQDGMPDVWEKRNNLNPKDGDDSSGYDLDKNYTNIEVYLNGLLK